MRHAQSYPNSEVCEAVESIHGHLDSFLKNRVGTFNPDPLGLKLALVLVLSRLIRRWFRSVGRAAALAFARVLAFTAVVTGLATAFALARVLPLAGVLVFLVACFAEADRLDSSLV
jgi:hypothetical protein